MAMCKLLEIGLVVLPVATTNPLWVIFVSNAHHKCAAVTHNPSHEIRQTVGVIIHDC